MDIDISKYISEDEKREIAIDVFREQVRSELFKTSPGSVQSDSEIQRVIGNISHDIVINEVGKYIPDFESLIIEKVKTIITTSELRTQVFKRKDVWDRNESEAVKIINSVVADNKAVLEERIKDTIANVDISKEVSKEVAEFFENISGNLYEISEVFRNFSKH
jgi:hypothetical protein